MGKYGLDTLEIFSRLPTFEEEVSGLPTKLQDATNFLKVFKIEHLRMTSLYAVAEDVYSLEDLDNCKGANLDMYGSDCGLLRGHYDDNDFRSLIRMYASFSRGNSGTIPDIKEIIRLTFQKNSSAVLVTDSRDGSVKLTIPVTAASEVFSSIASDIVAAGIRLEITLTSAFSAGILVQRAHEVVRDRDDNRVKFCKRAKLHSGKILKRYGARIELGLEGI